MHKNTARIPINRFLELKKKNVHVAFVQADYIINRRFTLKK